MNTMISTSVPEALDRIKMIVKSSAMQHVLTKYRIVKVPARYDGTQSVVCDTEVVHDYDDLCAKMFDLDVSGWMISDVKAEAVRLVSNLSPSALVVTIRMVENG